MGKISSVLAVASVGALAVSAALPASAAPAEKTARSLIEAEQPVVGEMEGFNGNAHFISFMADSTGKGDLSVVNFDCPDGAPPSWDYESGCEVLDIVGMYGYELDVDINKKLTLGTLSGEFQVYLGEAEDGSPIWGKTYSVDVVMKGYGKVKGTDDRQDGYRDLRKTRSANVESGTLLDPALGDEFDLAGAEGALLHQRTWSRYQ